MALEELQLIEQQIGQLDQEMANLLSQHQDAVQRLAEVPGLGVDSAQQIIAEVGATAATFPSAKQLSSWVGACPGDEESAGVNYSHRSPKGNRHMRRVLNQSANAAVKAKGSIFEIVYRRSVPRLGHNQTSNLPNPLKVKVGCRADERADQRLNGTCAETEHPAMDALFSEAAASDGQPSGEGPPPVTRRADAKTSN